MAFKQTLDVTTQNMLKFTNFFNTFCLSEEIKYKCVAIIQKQIIMKIII